MIVIHFGCNSICLLLYSVSLLQKKKTVKPGQDANDLSVPRSFVMHRGEIGKTVLQLETDLRRVMEPYTAMNLKV